jgi:hypothetical protein
MLPVISLDGGVGGHQTAAMIFFMAHHKTLPSKKNTYAYHITSKQHSRQIYSAFFSSSVRARTSLQFVWLSVLGTY